MSTLALAALLAAGAAAAAPSSPEPVRPELWTTAQEPVANGAFTADGSLVASVHPLFKRPNKLVLLRPGQPERPWPDAGWQHERAGGRWFDQVQGLRSDGAGRIWVLDMGGRRRPRARLFLFGPDAQLEREIVLPESVTPKGSQPQDFAIDAPRGRLYLADEMAGEGADPRRGALIVVDLATGAARRVLQGVPGTRAEDRDIVVDGRPLRQTDAETGETKPLRSGADGIALDAAGEWLHFGPLNGGESYRVPAAALADAALPEAELERKVERYAARPNAGGYMTDGAGALYLTEIENRAIGVIDPATRRYRRVVESPDMLWPDGMVAGGDGWIYVITSKLPTAAALNGGEDRSHPPWPVFRFKPPAPPTGAGGGAPAPPAG